MKLIKEKMKEKQISQIELAAKLKVSDSSVSKWLRWGVSIPTKHHKEICNILNCRMDDLHE